MELVAIQMGRVAIEIRDDSIEIGPRPLKIPSAPFDLGMLA